MIWIVQYVSRKYHVRLMSNAAWEALGQFLRAQRERCELKVEVVEGEAPLPKGTLYKFERGERLLNRRDAGKLKDILCNSQESKEQFEELYTKAQAQEGRQHQSPLGLRLDSPNASLRVLPVPYPPFSGAEEDCFVDWLMKRVLELAGIRYEIPDDFRAKIVRGDFDLIERIEAVKSAEADALINLASLQRVRMLTFLLTPIRVSLNGVMLRKHSRLLHDARTHLALGSLSSSTSFKILAIPNEVGWVHVTRTMKVPESDIKPLKTLNTRELASALRTSAYGVYDGRAAVLVCDELTALGVLRELGQEGAMVFQPSTDESVTQSEKRRYLPAHPLGIGVRRDDQQLYGYLEEAMRIFLLFENETVAARYEELYWKLVERTAKCLESDESVYFGGVRRLHLKSLSLELQETLLNQSARSYARRCLQLSRKALESVPREMEPWVRVLQRARERVQVGEARNRRRVKAVLTLALKTVAGLDPAESRDLDRADFEDAIGKKWSKLKYILERDLDIEIKPELRQEIPGDSLEGFVSRIQRLLDGSTDRASVTAVVDEVFPSTQFDELRNRFNSQFPDQKVIQNKDTKILVATNLGEAIGFIALRVHSPGSPAASMEIVGFYVAEHMRDGGVGSRLVRKAVEYADQQESNRVSHIESVWINSLVPIEAEQLFLRCGFRTEQGRLIYQIDRLRERRKSAKASTGWRKR